MGQSRQEFSCLDHWFSVQFDCNPVHQGVQVYDTSNSAAQGMLYGIRFDFQLLTAIYYLIIQFGDDNAKP